MPVDEKAIETLTGLGLTVLQAKVYIALAKEGKSTVKEIAKNSKVARQDLYRITPQLLELGLIVKHVNTPTKFEGIPIQAAIDILVERRKKETTQLEQASTELLRSFASNEERESKNEETQLMVINELQARFMHAKKQLLRSKKNVSIVTKWTFFLTYTLNMMEEHIRIMNNGVKVKIVTHKPEKIEILPKELQKLMKHPNFEIRYVACLPSSIVAVFDKAEVNILLASNKTPAETVMLMTNNPSLVELAYNYFEIMWLNSLDESNQQYQKQAQECKLFGEVDIKK